MSSSVAQSCPTLCDPMNSSTPGLPVHHQLLEFTQTHVHWVGDAIQLSHSLSSPSPPAFNLSQHQSFQMSQPFASGGQSTGVSASASVLPMNSQDWFPLGLTGLMKPVSVYTLHIYLFSSFENEDLSHAGFRSTFMTSFLLDYFCKDTISTLGHILSSWRPGPQHIFFQGIEIDP